MVRGPLRRDRADTLWAVGIAVVLGFCVAAALVLAALEACRMVLAAIMAAVADVLGAMR